MFDRLLARQIEACEQRRSSRSQSPLKSDAFTEAATAARGETPSRLRERLKRKGLDLLAADEMQGNEPELLERIIGAQDLLGSDFLLEGAARSRAVGRIEIRSHAGATRGYGTGFLVSPRLILTNNHVLPTRDSASTSIIGFLYRTPSGGRHPMTPQEFPLDPRKLFITDVGLDFTLVAIGSPQDGRTTESLGWLPLIRESGKAVVGERVNIIQHPAGRPQEIAIRDNLVDRIMVEGFMHYKADTQRGSSGAAVCNDEWDLAALHHSGVPKRNSQGQILDVTGQPWDNRRQTSDSIAWVANEGVRISSIVQHIMDLGLEGAHRDLVGEAFLAAPTAEEILGGICELPESHAGPKLQGAGAEKARSIGSASVLLEVSVRPVDGTKVVETQAVGTAASPTQSGESGGSGITVDGGDDRPLADPEFECISVHATSKAAARRALRKALREELELSSDDWRIEPVPARRGRFDLEPAEGQVITISEAWTLTRALTADENIVWAEPCFELNSDVLDEGVPPDSDDPSSNLTESDPVYDDEEYDWSPQLVRAPQAWAVTPPAGGKSQGEGIRIAHPDSGYRVHDELWTQQDPGAVDTNTQYDFVKNRRNPVTKDGGHGLATGSVILSRDNRSTDEASVTGVAPRATLVPLRVAKKRRFIPVPVLLRSGMRRLRKAIDYASTTQADCHVISISLGWIKNRGVHEAVQDAVDRNLIVCAAAGNKVRLVVWPARYPEVIAVAACDARRRRWKGSSRGASVDVSAPGKDVFKATVGKRDRSIVTRSSGTSYSVATTAGLAALWLAHHGRDALIQRYGQVRLQTVFRTLLKDSCDAPPTRSRGKFGAGIVNAERLLTMALPPVNEMLEFQESLENDLLESLPLGRSGGDWSTIAESLDSVPEKVCRSAMSGLLGVGEGDLDAAVAGFGDELAFHVLSDPDLREQILGLRSGSPREAREAMSSALTAESTSGDPGSNLRGNLSRELLERLQ